ncbi:hypothetical protein [Haloarchaeobius sp. DFWS5]|uniref:DUF7845 domain-containing protein n=1 Tax=Haloarchaeobius sp. DFWS5 TaxID=3446114 RepID=UPI003EBAB121
MTYVETAPHEFEGYLHYATNRDKPYWALSSIMQAHDAGFDAVEREHPTTGETWQLSTGYRAGSLVPRATDPINVEKLAEWKIMLRGENKRKATFFVRPRWKNMEYRKDDGSTSSLHTWCESDRHPDAGLDVEVDGSNIEPEEYPKLLCWAAREVANLAGTNLNERYFHPRGVYVTSKVTAYERYVRLRTDVAKKLIRMSGLFGRFHLLLGDERGTKYTYKVDNTDIVGKLHALQLQPSAARELPGGRRGKQLKHYHLKNRDAENADDRLKDPKFGVLLKKRFNGGQAFNWNDLEDLTREIDETLINCLSWAKIPTRGADPTVFGEDDVFTGGPRSEDAPTVTRYSDPTPNLEAKQENLLVRTLRDLTDADDDVLRAMTDGGKNDGVHPGEIAEEAGCSIRTVYRALSRLDELVENDNAAVRFRSEKIRQELHAVYERIENTVENGAKAMCRVLDLDPEVVKQNGGAFERWLTHYAADVVEDSPEQMLIKIGATLSRYMAGNGEYVGDVLDYLDKALARAGLDIDRSKIVVEWSDGNTTSTMGWFSRVLRQARDKAGTTTR